MRTRVLPASEWHRLDECELPLLLPHMNPDNVDVIVVEDAGKIVGTLAVMRITHFEGVWVEPEHRSGYVLGRLLHEAERIAMYRGEQWVLGAAKSDDERMDGLIRRRGGTALPLRVYTMPVGVN